MPGHLGHHPLDGRRAVPWAAVPVAAVTLLTWLAAACGDSGLPQESGTTARLTQADFEEAAQLVDGYMRDLQCYGSADLSGGELSCSAGRAGFSCEMVVNRGPSDWGDVSCTEGDATFGPGNVFCMVMEMGYDYWVRCSGPNTDAFCTFSPWPEVPLIGEGEPEYRVRCSPEQVPRQGADHDGRRSDRGVAPLAGSYTHRVEHGGNEDLTVADPARAGRLADCFDGRSCA